VTVSSGSGKIDYYSEGAKRELTYTIHWKEGSTTSLDQKHFFLKLSGVTGSLYKNGQVSSTFEGDEATANQKDGTLVLDGNVQVHSVNQKTNSTLFCEKMSYADSDRIVKATGSVHLSSDNFTLGDFEELWGSPDLKTVATPEMYVPEAASSHPMKPADDTRRNLPRHNLQSPAPTQPLLSPDPATGSQTR
jgi:hypothetical protein